MTLTAPRRDETVIAAPELRGAALELGRCRDLEVCIEGPAGCIAGETRIYNPVTGEHTPVKELYEKRIAPIVQTLIGAIQAEIPFRKGVADLFRVTLVSGRQCVVTGDHLVLTPTGWRFVSALSLGDLVGVGEPSAQSSYAHNSMHTTVSSQSCCLIDCHQCDVPPPHEKDTCPGVLPLQDGARVHVPSYLHTDDQVYGLLYTRLPYIRHANKGYSHQPPYMACTQSHDDRESLLHAWELSLYDVQSPHEIHPVQLVREQDQYCYNMHLNGNCLTQYPQPSAHIEPELVKTQVYQTFGGCLTSADRSQQRLNAAVLSTACSPSSSSPLSHNNTYVSYTNTSWDTLSSIEYVRTDEYFDLHVPLANHYLAEGIWHHNTGKTVAAIFKLHVMLSMYPNARALITRKTNTALAGSAMVTFREMLDPRERVVYYGGSKVRPAAFQYPNGSELVVSGLDKAEKIKSTAFDMALVNEPTDGVTLEDWEFIRSRLRHGKMPYHQMIADVNPVEPTFWLNQRMNAGITTRLLSRHTDNPRLFSTETNDWTDEGRRYIFEVLEGLTGVRLARLRYGIWAAASGAVYEGSYDRAIHVIDRFTPSKDWPRWISIDYGFTNPFVAQWWCQDHDGRIYLYREIYKTKTLVEDHAKTIALASGWYHLLPRGHEKYKATPADWADPLPRAIICDTDAEDRFTLERHLGLYTTPAKKTVSDGIQAVAARLKRAGDGKPRLYLMRDTLVERDADLAQKKKPTCTVEEMEGYVWSQNSLGVKEEPVKQDDHGNDCMRYMCAAIDLVQSNISYFSNIWR